MEVRLFKGLKAKQVIKDVWCLIDTGDFIEIVLNNTDDFGSHKRFSIDKKEFDSYSVWSF